MKLKKRIPFHLTIQLLAIICIACFSYIIYHQHYLYDLTEAINDYSSNYSNFCDDVVNSINDIITLKSDYSDPDRVVFSDGSKDYTVADIINYATNDFLDLYEDPDISSTTVSAVTDQTGKYIGLVDSLELPYDIMLQSDESQDKFINKYLERFDTKNSNIYFNATVDLNNNYIVYKNSNSIINHNNFKDIVSFSDGIIKGENNIDLLDTRYLSPNIKLIKSITFGVNSKFPADDQLARINSKYVTAATNSFDYEFFFWILIIASAIAVLIAFITYIFLLAKTWRISCSEDVALSWFDKLWFDCMIIVFYSSAFLSFVGLKDEFLYYYNLNSKSDIQNLLAILISVIALITVEFTIVMSESFVKRIAAHKFLSSSLLGKLVLTCKKIVMDALDYLGSLGKAFAITAALCFGEFVIFLLLLDGPHLLLVFFLMAVGDIGLFLLLLTYFKEQECIKQACQLIVSGDIDTKITENFFFPTNKRFAETINNLGEGLSTAIEKSIKNERLKSELITNVSHDLKTPLTSIINYIDLLKLELASGEDQIDDAKVSEYITILENKSARLKNLTEDLVEASKLTSGVITLDKQKIDLVQLVKQSIGELGERLSEKNLEIISALPDAPIYINADGRKMWRVFENIYSNIYKYALPNTRVYINVTSVGKKVGFTIRNISQNPLNFDASELTERFVRGDMSRTTEGNGLGLSIARSIIETHDGTFNIAIDGDLFKVIIEMTRM